MRGNTIENCTDQIFAYSQEVASTIQDIAKQYDLTWEQAKEVVKIGSSNILAETLHHSLNDIIEELPGIVPYELPTSISEIAEAIDDFVLVNQKDLDKGGEVDGK